MTKQYEDAIAEASFGQLKQGILNFINRTHFERFTMILRSGGFVSNDLITGQNAVNFAYILYLRGRYSNSPATAFDVDIRQIEARGLMAYADIVIAADKGAQVKLGDKGFLSRDITVQDLLMNRSDVHHVYPKNYLMKKQSLTSPPSNSSAN